MEILYMQEVKDKIADRVTEFIFQTITAQTGIIQVYHPIMCNVLQFPEQIYLPAPVQQVYSYQQIMAVAGLLSITD